jgi:Bacterial protein of unknown function (DUF922)
VLVLALRVQERGIIGDGILMGRGVVRVAAGVLAWCALVAGQAPEQTEEVIVWSAARQLDWKDFKAKPEGGALGGARIAISHDYSIGCRDGVLQARVRAIMQPARSWVTYRIVSSGLASRVGLRHEQLHFDLAEVYARRIRKLMQELPRPCTQSDAELNAMAERVIKEHWDLQQRYEVQTEHGQVERQQNEWERKITSELKQLAAFREPGMPETVRLRGGPEVPELTLKCRVWR